MAVAFVANRFNSASAATGFPIIYTLTTANTIAVGNTLVLTIVMDDSSFPDGVIAFPSINDPRFNFWKLLEYSRRVSASGAPRGMAVYILACYVQEAYQAADQLQVSFFRPDAPSTPQPGLTTGYANIDEYSGVDPVLENTFATTSGLGNAATLATLAPPSAAAGDLYVGVIGQDSTTNTIVGDADVTGGAWVTRYTNGTSSVRILVQHKIPNTSASQSWATTWGGAAFDYAAAGVFLKQQVGVFPPANPLPTGNANYPCIAGSETLPLETITLPVDTGTGYAHTFEVPDGYNGSSFMSVLSEYETPSEKTQHTLAFDWYANDELAAQAQLDEITTVTLPLNGGFAGLGVTQIGGDAFTTVAEALASPGGDIYFEMDGSTFNDTISLYFDTSPLDAYPSHRIVRVGIKYLAWKDDSSPPIPGEGLTLSLVDPDGLYDVGASAVYGSWLINSYQNAAQIETRWLGETNAIGQNNLSYTAGFVHPNQKMPFTLTDLYRMSALTPTQDRLYLFIKGDPGYDLLQTTTYLDFLQLVVELVPERRAAVSHRIVSNVSRSVGTVDNAADFSFTPEFSDFKFSLNTEQRIALPATGTPTVVVREALPASPSDRYRANPDGSFVFTRLEAFGPSTRMKGVSQSRNDNADQQVIQRAPVVNGLLRPGSEPLPQVLTALSYADFSTVAAVGPSLTGSIGLNSYAFLRVSTTSEVDTEMKVDGTTTYDKLRVLVKRESVNADLTFTVERPYGTTIATATLTEAAYDAAADTGNGWKEILVNLSAPITPTAGTVFVVAATTSSGNWLVAAYDTVLDGLSGYLWFARDDIQYASSRGTFVVPAIVLSCSLAAPDLDISTVSTAIDQEAAPCVVGSTISVPRIDVNNSTLYDRIVVERIIPSAATYETVAVLIDDLTEFTDIGVPWDQDLGYRVRYRITGWRDADRRSVSSTIDWTGISVAPGAAFGLVNYDTEQNYVYAPVDSSDLELVWEPLNPIESVQLHQQDYQIALRSSEERGLQVSAVIAVKNFARCDLLSATAAGSLGGRSLTPEPFDTIRELENASRLQLQFPGGDTRWVTLDLGSLRVATAHGVYLAEIVLTDTTPPNPDPYAG